MSRRSITVVKGKYNSRSTLGQMAAQVNVHPLYMCCHSSNSTLTVHSRLIVVEPFMRGSAVASAVTPVHWRQWVHL
eukprot:2258384-Amphidinium_carterae.2